MNKIATINSLIGISVVMVFMGVYQMTTSHVSEEQFHHTAVLQQYELQTVAETANYASKQTLDFSTNGTDALHTAIWAVARDLPNADGQRLDNEINRDAQTALNQTRQMIVAELTENVEALYQDATRTMAYHDVVLVKIADAN